MIQPTANFEAPLGGSVKILTAIAYAILGTVLAALWWAVRGGNYSHGAIWIGSTVVGLLAILSPLLRIRGYLLSSEGLVIRYGVWRKVLRFSEIFKVERAENVFRGAWRIFGGGGLWSFIGLFHSAQMGRFRSYVSDTNRLVLIKGKSGLVVLSPENPDLFVQSLSERLTVVQ